MDYSNDQPERLWVTQPDAHPELAPTCGGCNQPIDRTHAVPIMKEVGPLCQGCATDQVKDHPVTPTYLHWLQSGDPRWWSVWCCNCEGCAPDEVPEEGSLVAG